MKSVVITGATSMLGISLINECVKNKIFVLALVRKNSCNISLIPKSNFVQIVEISLRNYKDFSFNLAIKYDVFFHLAWEYSNRESRNDCCLQKSNIDYTLDSVYLAYSLGCSKYVFAGSQAEYGIKQELINPDTSINPNTAYGVAKYSAEQFSKIMCQQLGIQHVATRIFSVYGINDRLDSMVNYCILNLFKGIPPKLTKCEQRWDYLFSEDAGKALKLIGEHGKNLAVYCLASGASRSLYEYVKIIEKVVASNVKVKFGAKCCVTSNIGQLQACTDNLRKDTGFVVETSFEEGITKTFNWLKERHLL